MIPRFKLRLFHVTIWICCWRMNTLVTSQYQPRLSSITKILSRRRISQSECSIQIKLNYYTIYKCIYFYFRLFWSVVLTLHFNDDWSVVLPLHFNDDWSVVLPLHFNDDWSVVLLLHFNDDWSVVLPLHFNDDWSVVLPLHFNDDQLYYRYIFCKDRYWQKLLEFFATLNIRFA
jgi:hypothetical protein